MKLKHRLDRLETLAKSMVPQKDTLQLEDSYDLIVSLIPSEILSPMSVEHKADLFSNLEKYLKRDDYQRDKCKPLSLIFDRLWEKHGRRSKPFYLGPEFYDAYQNGAKGFHDCEDCGCEIPVFTPLTLAIHYSAPVAPGPIKRVADKCPLCGGVVGSNAYYYKHGKSYGEVER